MDVRNLNNIKAKEIIPGYHVKFVHSDNMTEAYWHVDAGAVAPDHSHPHEQIVNVLEGEFELTVNGEPKQLKPGCVVVIPPEAKHSGRAITDCQIMDVFYPVREDYR